MFTNASRGLSAIAELVHISHRIYAKLGIELRVAVGADAISSAFANAENYVNNSTQMSLWTKRGGHLWKKILQNETQRHRTSKRPSIRQRVSLMRLSED